MSHPSPLSVRRRREATGRPPGPARARDPRRAALVGAALVVTLLAAGCGEDDGGPDGADGDAAARAPRAKLLHKVPSPAAKVRNAAGTMGMWTTDKHFVKADLGKIVGYPLDGGQAAWTVRLGGELCWSTPEATEDGMVAVLFKDPKDAAKGCTRVGLVDLNRGRLRWQREGKEDGSAQMFDEVTIGAGTVAAGGTSGTAGWTLGGRPLWAPEYERTCGVRGYAGEGDSLVAVRDCGSTDHPRLKVQTLDPRSRTPKSTFPLPAGTEYVHVVSVRPLVLAVDDGKAQGGSGVSEFLSVDDSGARGRLRGRIDAKGGKYGKYTADCPSSEITGCKQLAVDPKAGLLHLATEKPVGSGSDAENSLVSFDLKTGEAKGTVEGTEAGELIPMGLDGSGKVLAYQKSDMFDERGGGVWRLDPAGGTKKQLLQNASETYKVESDMEIGENRYRYAEGRLYLGADEITSPSAGSKAPPLAAVFGRAG